MQVADAVVRAIEGERLVGEEALQDDGGLLESLDSHRRRLEPHAGVLVLLAKPSGSQADLEPTFGEDVEGGQLLGEHCWLAEVLGEHGLGDAQGRRCVGHGLPGDERSEGSDEVVGKPERGVAESLDDAGRCEQLGSLRGRSAGVTESDAPRAHRGCISGLRRVAPSRRITSPLR